MQYFLHRFTCLERVLSKCWVHKVEIHSTHCLLHSKALFTTPTPLCNIVISQHFKNCAKGALKCKQNVVQHVIYMLACLCFSWPISNYVCVYTLYFLYADFFENLFFATFWPMEIARRTSECSRSVCQTTQQFAPATHATSTHAQTHTHTHTDVCWCCYVHLMCTYAYERNCMYEMQKTLICVQVNYQEAACCCRYCCCCLYANMAASKYEQF